MRATTMNLRTFTRGVSTLTTALITTGLLASTALAYWTTLGGGGGQASAGTLLPPTGVSANPISGSSTSLRVSWSHPTGLQPTSYAVTAGSQGCTAAYPASTCDVTGLTANTAYSVTATSLYRNAWTAPATATTGTTNPAAPALTVTTPANGATNVATNTAISGGTDATGNVAVAIYLGTNTAVAPVGTLTGTVTGATWTTPPATLLNNTQYTAVATQSTAGGSSTAQTSFTTVSAVSVQTPAPSTPDLLAADDSGSSNTDNVTNVARPRFAGTAAAGSLVKLYRAGAEIGSQQLSAGATTWEITPAADVVQGQDVAITATAQAPGMTVSNASTGLAVTFDRTAPVVSASAEAAGNGNNRAVSGTAGILAGDAGTVSLTMVKQAGSGTCNSFSNPTPTVNGSTGAWTANVNLDSNTTCRVTASQTDAAGNIGTSGPADVVRT